MILRRALRHGKLLGLELPFLNEIVDVDVKIPINDEMKQLLLTQNIEIEKEIEEIKRKERLQKKMQHLEEKANDGNKLIAEEDSKSDITDNESSIFSSSNNSSIITYHNNSTDEILGLVNTDEKEKEKELNINNDDNLINNDLNILNSNININFNPDSEIKTGENEEFQMFLLTQQRKKDFLLKVITKYLQTKKEGKN